MITLKRARNLPRCESQTHAANRASLRAQQFVVQKFVTKWKRSKHP